MHTMYGLCPLTSFPSWTKISHSQTLCVCAKAKTPYQQETTVCSKRLNLSNTSCTKTAPIHFKMEIELFSFKLLHGLFPIVFINTIQIFSLFSLYRLRCSQIELFSVDGVICNLIHVIWFWFFHKQVQTFKHSKNPWLITVNQLKHRSDWWSC